MATPRLIARADDYGSFRSANLAILETFRKGIVRNVSVLAVGHKFDEGASALTEAHGLCVGLHATIAAEWDNVRWPPVLPPGQVPALVDDAGDLVKTPVIAKEQGADPEQIIAEVAAQLDRCRSAGLAIEYLDTHMGFDWIDGVHEALADLCEREGILFANALEGLDRCPRSDSDDPLGALAEGISSMDGGTYLLVGHPAYHDDEMADVGHKGYEPPRVARAREVERRMFTDGRVLAAVRSNGVDLIRYTES
jgi:hypothetical protein